MRSLRVPMLLVALLCSTSAIADQPMLPRPFTRGDIEPVLVAVDAQGKITEILPAYQLPPELMRLLSTNLAEMIHQPARDKHGKPISSQFVINVALKSDKEGNGNVAAHFEYVSAKPIPPGRWYWSYDEVGRRLGLVGEDGFLPPF